MSFEGFRGGGSYPICEVDGAVPANFGSNGHPLRLLTCQIIWGCICSGDIAVGEPWETKGKLYHANDFPISQLSSNRPFELVGFPMLLHGEASNSGSLGPLKSWRHVVGVFFFLRVALRVG